MSLETYKKEITDELDNILNFWTNHTLDTLYGGFIGKMDNKGQIDYDAPKGLVLNARILWTFAAAYRHTWKTTHKAMAKRAYDTLDTVFKDIEHEGYHWSITAEGQPLSKRKQIYGQAFVLYGLSEYYKISKNQLVKQQAIHIFNLIEKYAFDSQYGGYWEAFAEDWSPLNDLRLSEKDRNDPKTMNTHLHILEAYTNLYHIWQNERLYCQIAHLIDIFLRHFIENESKHLVLFFNEKWESQDKTISYGHDIEAAWLLQEAAEAIQYRVEEVKNTAIDIAQVTLKALATEGALLYENHLPEIHWWVQAEGMIGFFNAYELTQESNYLQASLDIWHYVKNHLRDNQKGEWFWGRDTKGEIMTREDKVGFWKCPYHNVRACLELIHRIKNIKTMTLDNNADKQVVFEMVKNTIQSKKFKIVNEDASRPWGGFLVVDETQAPQFINTFFPHFSIEDFEGFDKLSPKILLVAPHKRLSWQYHNRRSEIWTVIAGNAALVRSDTDTENPKEILPLGSTIILKQGERHRLIGLDEWGIIAEIWQHTDSNDPSNEDDIIRVQDDFGR